MPRMRTAAGVFALIQEQDPDTEVTLHYIRALIKTGKVPVTPVGRKLLVDADVLIRYIATGENAPQKRIIPIRERQIRKVAL